MTSSSRGKKVFLAGLVSAMVWAGIGIAVSRDRRVQPLNLLWIDQLFAARQNTAWAPRVNPNVLIVGIDERTRNELRDRLGGDADSRRLTREAIARLLTVCAKARAKVVGVDFYLDAPLTAGADGAVESALAGNKSLDVPGVDAVLGCLVTLREEKRPLERFSQWAAEGNVILQPDADGKFRRIRPALVVDDGALPIFAFQVCRLFLGKVNSHGRALDTPWQWHNESDGSLETPGLHVPGDMLIDFTGPAQTWEIAGLQYSAIEVIDGKVPPETFTGKIVLIGSTVRGDDRFTVSVAPSAEDGEYREFLSRRYGVDLRADGNRLALLRSGAMSGVEIHANAISQMLDGRHLHEASTEAPWLVPAAIGVVVVGLGWTFYNDPRGGKSTVRRGMVGAFVLFFIVFVGVIVASGAAFFVWHWGVVPLGLLAAWSGQAVCGMVFSTAALRRQNRRISQMFGNAVGEELLEYLSAHPEILSQPTHRTATVLFCDIRGFTPLAEALDSHRVVAMLQEHFEAMWKPLATQGAWIDKYVGDMVMAAWNVLKPGPDHALRAVRAAVEMKIVRQRLNRDRAEHDLPPIEIGVGIHSGEVVGGNVGSRKRSNFTLIGDSVNLASRIQDQARGGEILISEATYNMLKERVVARSLPPTELPGKSGRHTLYEVFGIRGGPFVPGKEGLAGEEGGSSPPQQAEEPVPATAPATP